MDHHIVRTIEILSSLAKYCRAYGKKLSRHWSGGLALMLCFDLRLKFGGAGWKSIRFQERPSTYIYRLSPRHILNCINYFKWISCIRGELQYVDEEGCKAWTQSPMEAAESYFRSYVCLRGEVSEDIIDFQIFVDQRSGRAPVFIRRTWNSVSVFGPISLIWSLSPRRPDVLPTSVRKIKKLTCYLMIFNLA